MIKIIVEDSSSFDRDLTNLRTDLKGELDAINLYQKHIDETDNPTLKKIWTSIMEEEKVHVGELTKVINEQDPKEEELFDDGQSEAEDMLDVKKP